MSRVAVIDFGTNSTRLLVADVSGGLLEELERRTNVTRLGEGVDATGRLAEAAMERVYETVAEYRRIIDGLGAERTVAVATSAVRESANGDEFRRALVQRFGVDAQTISGGEEARLTFLGATAGRPAGDGATLVIDIGGGSTELVVGSAGEPPGFHVSTQAGSVRQTERHIADDPPPPDDVTAMAEEIRSIFDAAVPGDVRARVRNGIAVAGTVTSLAAIDQKLDRYERERVNGYALGLPACERMLAMLAAKPLEDRRVVPGLNPARAPTIVAGAVILVEAMRLFDLDVVETCEADILQGAAVSPPRPP